MRLLLLALILALSVAGSVPRAAEASLLNRGLPHDEEDNIRAADATNDHLFPLLSDLVRSPYFRYVKMDLTKDCPFWRENAKCMNRDCVVETMDEGEVLAEAPFMYKQVNLGDVTFGAPSGRGLGGGSAGRLGGGLGAGGLGGGGGALGALGGSFAKCEFAKDFCVLEDEQSPDGVYIDLVDNPERFTGYSGVSANNIWSAIYNENCFGVPSSLGTPIPPAPLDVCLEKQVFYRIVSGLHASISIHICSQYLNKDSGNWERHPQCYAARVGAFPERVANVYFVHSMLLRAVSMVAPLLDAVDVCTGKPAEDDRVRAMLADIVAHAKTVGGFDETTLFQGPHAPLLVDEVRTKFRNVSRIMDCVSCQKCRLWGKTQVTGLGTALKVLFGTDPRILSGEVSPARPVLSRYEVVALFNTLNRFVESVHDIRAFEAQLDAEKSLSTSSFEAAAATSEIAASSLPAPIIPDSPVTSPPEPAATDVLAPADLEIDDHDADEPAAVRPTGFVPPFGIDLSYWKVIASVLTAFPFLFGVAYGFHKNKAPSTRKPAAAPPARPAGFAAAAAMSAPHPVYDDDSDTDDALDTFAHAVHAGEEDAADDSDDEADDSRGGDHRSPADAYSSSGLSDADEDAPVSPRPVSPARRRPSASSSSSPSRSGAGVAALRGRALKERGYDGSVEASETEGASEDGIAAASGSSDEEGGSDEDGARVATGRRRASPARRRQPRRA
ncbi:endoplasmic oxidoreductin-1 [Blastocladiella emersonii ATCC 22665]|nr:endoplasmic oxidoreductin-1 [Blastocladiella emersonii ATCC 22665]